MQASTTISPIAASITAILYNASGTCGTGSQTALGTFNLTSAATTIAPATNTNGKSVKLTASATSTTPAGSAFLNWASSTGGAFNVVPGEPLAICVPGSNGNQTDTFQPVYATTTTSVVSSANPSVFGQSVTFTATVTSLIGGTLPSGAGSSVTFKDGATTLGSANVNASGQATLATAALTVTGSPHSITAIYTGSGSFTTSTSSAISQVVNPASTTTTITSDTPDPSIAGQAVTVNYAVAPVSPGAGTIAGNVTVTDGVDSCIGTVTAGTCSISLTTLGARTLTASYAATTNFTGSISGGTPHQVNQAPSTTTLTSSANPSVVGQSVMFTATVKNGTTPITVGNIKFIEGGSCASPGTMLQANQAVNATGVVTYASSPSRWPRTASSPATTAARASRPARPRSPRR